MSVYLCTQCSHYVSDHRPVPGGEIVDGPFACSCGCFYRPEYVAKITDSAYRQDPERYRAPIERSS